MKKKVIHVLNVAMWCVVSIPILDFFQAKLSGRISLLDRNKKEIAIRILFIVFIGIAVGMMDLYKTSKRNNQ